MKRNFLPLIFLFIYVVAGYAQPVGIEPDTYLRNSEQGSFKEANLYNTGIVYILNNGSNDVVSYALDEENYTQADVLDQDMTKYLQGWTDDPMSFYQGKFTSESDYSQVRILNNGTASGLFISADGTNLNVAGIVKAPYSTGARYYNFINGGYSPFARTFLLNVQETNGTVAGTSTLAEDPAFGGMALNTNVNNTGEVPTIFIDQSLYFATPLAAGFGSEALIKINYDEAGSTISKFAQFESGSAAKWSHLAANDTYIFATSYNASVPGTEPMTFINLSDPTQITTSTAHNFYDTELIESNNKIFAISEPTAGFRKLTVVNGPDDISVIDINGVDEDDFVDNLVLSGNKLFFTATMAGSSGIYVIRTDVENPTPIVATSTNGQDIIDMEATPYGMVYGYYDTTFGISKIQCLTGVIGNNYFLSREIESGGEAFKEIKKLVVNGNTLYIFEDDGAGNTDISTSDLSNTKFKNGTVNFTVTHNASGDPIQDVTITLNNGLNEHTVVTDANGQVTLVDIEQGSYDMVVSADGYFGIETEYRVYEGTNNKSITMDKETEIASFDFIITDDQDNPLEGAEVSLSNYTYSWSATSGSDGHAGFTDVVYGDYKYEITMDGYETIKSAYGSDFSVSDATTEGLTIKLRPAKDFIFKVYDEEIYNAFPGEGLLKSATVKLVNNTNSSESYRDGTGSSGDEFGVAYIDKVPYGDYTLTVTKSGYEDMIAIANFTVNADTDIEHMYTIVPTKRDINIIVYDSEVRGTDDVGGELGGAKVVLDDGYFQYEATSSSNITSLGFAEFVSIRSYQSYTITVTKDGYEPYTVTKTINKYTKDLEYGLTETTPTSINEPENASLKVYPNPVKDILNITAPGEIVEVRVFDITGTQKLIETGHSITQINLASLAKGIYVLRARDINGNVNIVKVNKL